MKVLYFTLECKPFSKVGGVGDVAGELPVELKNQGIDLEIVTPLYGSINKNFIGEQQFEYDVSFNNKIESVQIFEGKLQNVRVNFIRNPAYFEGKYSQPYINSSQIPFYDDALRFSFFCEAALELIKNKNPDIVHINDWGLGFLFGRMVMEGFPQKRINTIHNVTYQGNIGKEAICDWPISKILEDSKIGESFTDPNIKWKSINPLRLGLELAHKTNTVSPNYAIEMTKPENLDAYFSGGKQLCEIADRQYKNGQLLGILNGFNYKFNPTDYQFRKTLKKKAEFRKELGRHFKNPKHIILGFVGRAVDQKFKLLTEKLDGKPILEHILEKFPVNLAFVASGDPKYEKFLQHYQQRNNFSATIAFDVQKAQQVNLGSDVFLMPSEFEPCGITQLEAMQNATPPLVRWTGGLTDTVISYNKPNGTGFGFDGSTRTEVLQELLNIIAAAVQIYNEKPLQFRKIQKNGFKQRFTWQDSAKRYIDEMYNQ